MYDILKNFEVTGEPLSSLEENVKKKNLKCDKIY